VATRHEPWNELPSERPRGARDQDLHGFSPRRCLHLMTRENNRV
jgi:hypothetical protein